MPYGYYMLVRFVSMVAFGVMAYRYYTQSKVALTITFASFALLLHKKHEKAAERWPFFFLTPFAKLNFRLS